MANNNEHISVIKKYLTRPYPVLMFALGFVVFISMTVFAIYLGIKTVVIEDSKDQVLAFLVFDAMLLALLLFIVYGMSISLAWLSFDMHGVHIKYPLKFKKCERELTIAWNECKEILFCNEEMRAGAMSTGVNSFLVVFSKEHVPLRIPGHNLNEGKIDKGNTIAIEYRKKIFQGALQYVEKDRILYPAVLAKRKPKDYAEFYGAD